MDRNFVELQTPANAADVANIVTDGWKRNSRLAPSCVRLAFQGSVPSGG